MANKPNLRARDVDRDYARTVLQTAFDDGQLDGFEFRQRSAAVDSARTLAELDSQVGDLQSTTPAPVPKVPKTSNPLRGRLIAAFVAVAVVVVAIIAMVLIAHRTNATADQADSAQSPSPITLAPPAAADPEPIIATPAAPLTVTGFHAMAQQYAAQYGDDQVVLVSLYNDYASLWRTEGAAVRRISFRGGIEPGDVTAPSSVGAPFGLSQVNIDAILALTDRFADLTGLTPAPDRINVSIEVRGRGLPVQIRGTSTDGRSASVGTDLAGEALEVRKG